MKEVILKRLDQIQEDIKEVRSVVESTVEDDEQQPEPICEIPVRLSVSDYALKVQISRHTVYNWAEKGLIKLGKSGKYTIVEDFPGKAEGVIRFPSREEMKACGYSQAPKLSDVRFRGNGGGRKLVGVPKSAKA